MDLHLRRIAPALAGLVAAALVAGAVLFHVDQEQVRYEQSVRASVIGVASGLRAELERAIDARTSLLDGLSGYAVAQISDGTIDPDRFEVFASRLVASSEVPLRSVQLAPAAVVTHVYPVEGNEAAVGHDLLADEARRQSVLDTIAAGAPVVAGPLELLQGGRAVIIRSPIFREVDGQEEWWGLATVVADFDPLIEESGLAEVDPSMEVAVRFIEGRRNDFGREVYGDLELFREDPVTFDVTLPSGTWELGLIPSGGWDELVWPRRVSTIFGGFVVAALVGLLVSRLVGSQQRYRRASDDLEQLIDTAGVPIVQLDANGVVVGWNRATELLTGLDESEILGRGLEDGPGVVDSLTDDAAAFLREVIGSVIESGTEARGLEVELELAGGTRTLIVSVSPQRDGSGRIVGAVVVAQDISDRLDAEEVRTENLAIARTARLKDEFLAGMSHELRTPLNGIIGLSSILEKRTFGELNDKQGEYVAQIHRSGRHLLDLINDVLDLARIEAEQEELMVETIDVVEIVDGALSLVRELAHAKQLEVRADIPEGLPSISADRRRLTQVLVNLLSNAVKFTPDGGQVGVTVRAAEDLRITVWDTGIGIAREKQSLLFRPFQQVDAALNRGYGGTGLGLSLSHRLVELHGGSIRVDSAAGQGARFTVTLPVHGGAVATVDSREPVEVTPLDDEGAIRVLLADDNDINRQLVQDYLTLHGVHVTPTADGVEVVEAAREGTYDVVLMDIQMPRRDGLEATRMLKADPRTLTVPVVALTALAMEGDDARCLAAGCDAYLSKPIDPEEVLSLVRELAGSSTSVV